MEGKSKLTWILGLFFILSLVLNLYFFTKSDKDIPGSLPQDMAISGSTSATVSNRSVPNEIVNVLGGDISTENIFHKSYEEFQKIGSYVEYNNWYKVFWNDLFLWFLIRLNDLESYKKFWLYQYEYYISTKDENFVNEMRRINISNAKDFSEFMAKEFPDLVNSKIVLLDQVDYSKGDMHIIYNNLSIENAVRACQKLKEDFADEYGDDENSCENKVYAFKATKENTYCAKISDPYKLGLCNDFLNYQNK